MQVEAALSQRFPVVTDIQHDRLLNISAGTVQIHRKNIYQKLGINSQGELFSQFIRGLTS